MSHAIKAFNTANPALVALAGIMIGIALALGLFIDFLQRVVG